MHRVTFGIKTFERPACCQRLIDSIRRFYPAATILVADDGRAESVNHATHVFKLPFDSGLSAGRNHLVNRTDTEFFLLLDDDFVFTKKSRIERLVELVAARVTHVMGGALWEPHRNAYRANPRLFELPQPTTLHVKWGHRDEQHCGERLWCPADMISNFFLARTSTLLDCPWDPAFKIAHEHLDFFWRLYQRGYRVGYTPDVEIEHAPERSPAYRRFRYRKVDNDALCKKHGLLKIVQDDAHAKNHGRATPDQ